MTLQYSKKIAVYLSFAFTLFLFCVHAADAATLRLSPDTGVYTSGSTFTARVLINTAGKPVNAAEGRLTFNPLELSVVSVSRGGSIFALWTEEPSFSNSAGTITFGGGSPSGYTGSAGTVMSVTFRSKAAGTPKVVFAQGSVLAADGLGTNVLTNMTGGAYTIGANVANPAPEYIAPANTPAAPKITSTTHPDSSLWYSNTAELSWTLPSGISSVRTILDQNAGTIPTKVYDTPISNISIEDLDEGVSYFHLQFKNDEGWGRVAHYRLGVDTVNPSNITISQPENNDPTNPAQVLLFEVEDESSPVNRYAVQIDGAEPVEFIDEESEGVYTLPSLDPGSHTIVVEAFDGAGNSIVGTHTFTIASFDRPEFTEYPTRLNNEVIPVLRGLTRPDASVEITLAHLGSEVLKHTVTSDADGVFTFIPDTVFAVGVYDVFAIATDQHGAKSDPSETIRMIVEVPGYMKVGGLVVSVLSILIPVVALFVLLLFGTWYLWHRLVVWRRKVKKEAVEAENTLVREFDVLVKNMHGSITKLTKARRGKLTKAETALIDQVSADISTARTRIKKEIQDIEDIVK